MSRRRLTIVLLRAMQEALFSRLAGERDNDGDPEAPRTEDYERAVEWVSDQIAKRERK